MTNASRMATPAWARTMYLPGRPSFLVTALNTMAMIASTSTTPKKIRYGMQLRRTFIPSSMLIPNILPSPLQIWQSALEIYGYLPVSKCSLKDSSGLCNLLARPVFQTPYPVPQAGKMLYNKRYENVM